MRVIAIAREWDTLSRRLPNARHQRRRAAPSAALPLLARYESSTSALFQNSDLKACLYSLSFSRALTSTA